tara:strand:+ start:602 stop:1186 length:585 start_codon:yes stop_codon:yes gene_type:complete
MKKFLNRKKKASINPDFSNLSNSLNTHMNQYIKEVEKIDQHLSKQLIEFNSLKEMYLQLQTGLAAKEKELAKYEKGYENIILQRFYEEFINLNELINECALENKESDLSKVSKYSFYLLQNLKIEQYSYELGSDFRDVEGINIHPDYVTTHDEEKDGKIAEILKEGYKVVNDDLTTTYIKKVEAKIFKFSKEEG